MRSRRALIAFGYARNIHTDLVTVMVNDPTYDVGFSLLQLREFIVRVSRQVYHCVSGSSAGLLLFGPFCRSAGLFCALPFCAFGRRGYPDLPTLPQLFVALRPPFSAYPSLVRRMICSIHTRERSPIQGSEQQRTERMLRLLVRTVRIRKLRRKRLDLLHRPA